MWQIFLHFSPLLCYWSLFQAFSFKWSLFVCVLGSLCIGFSEFATKGAKDSVAVQQPLQLCHNSSQNFVVQQVWKRLLEHLEKIQKVHMGK